LDQGAVDVEAGAGEGVEGIEVDVGDDGVDDRIALEGLGDGIVDPGRRLRIFVAGAPAAEGRIGIQRNVMEALSKVLFRYG
jgi:hypothetical protein